MSTEVMAEYHAPEVKTLQGPDAIFSMQNVTGVWLLDKRLSSNIRRMLKLQKIPWILRKAIDTSPIHLHLNQYTTNDPKTNEAKVHLDLVQRMSVNVGIGVIEDKRVLDWEERLHEDYLFGTVLTRSQLITGAEFRKAENEKEVKVVRPDIKLNVHLGSEDGDMAVRFLRGEINADGSECDGFVVEPWPGSDSESEGKMGHWVQTLECNKKSAWTAETIWGIEIVEGGRYLTSRVVIVDGKGNIQLGRCVFGLLKR